MRLLGSKCTPIGGPASMYMKMNCLIDSRRVLIMFSKTGRLRDLNKTHIFGMKGQKKSICVQTLVKIASISINLHTSE